MSQKSIIQWFEARLVVCLRQEHGHISGNESYWLQEENTRSAFVETKWY